MQRQRSVRSTPSAPVVVVAGVPGAGKSVALREVAAVLPQARVLDPEQITAWLRNRLPDGVPYRRYRALTHLAYWLAVIRTLAVGRTDQPLVVHDTATREWSRRLVASLARARGRQVSVIFLDVDHSEALWGQHERGRLVPASSFDRHWQRWSRLRGSLNYALDAEGWNRVLVTSRDWAVADIVEIVEPFPAPITSPALVRTAHRDPVRMARPDLGREEAGVEARTARMRCHVSRLRTGSWNSIGTPSGTVMTCPACGRRPTIRGLMRTCRTARIDHVLPVFEGTPRSFSPRVAR